jgi:hypothetical protein
MLQRASQGINQAMCALMRRKFVVRQQSASNNVPSAQTAHCQAAMEFQAPHTAVESSKHEFKPRCGFEGGFTKVSLPELLSACKLNQKPAKETNMSDVLHAGHSMSADMQQSTTTAAKAHLASRVRAAARSLRPKKAESNYLRKNR